MTRRDYCAKCSEMVHDYDVKCTKCYHNLCYDCITTYDALSRLAMLEAKFNVLCKSEITQDEFVQFIEDIKSKEMTDYIEKICSEDGKYYVEMKNDFNEKKDTLIKSYYENNNEEFYLKYIKTFLFDTYFLDEPIAFICLSCHNNIKN